MARSERPGAAMASTTRARRLPTQERSRRTVERILDAAERLIAEAGVEAATTRAIAERAEVAAPSLYRFFADRDEVLDALLERMLADLEAHVAAAEAGWEPGSAEELVRLALDVHIAYFKAHPSLATLWFGGRASPAVVASVRARNHRLALRLGRILTARGLVREDIPPAVFDYVVELGDRVLELVFRPGGRPDRRAADLGVVALGAFLGRWAPSAA